MTDDGLPLWVKPACYRPAPALPPMTGTEWQRDPLFYDPLEESRPMSDPLDLPAPTPAPVGLNPYDLVAPTRPLLPLPPGAFLLTEAQRARNWRAYEAERRKTEARVAQETAVALDEWTRLCDRHAGEPATLAALAIHRPETGHDRVVCAECEESDGEDTIPVAWQCRTYTAIRQATDA